MRSSVVFLFKLLSLCLLLVPGLGLAKAELQQVNLQLRWNHQFQFAGYYMAKEKGFYRQAKLEVNIRAGGSGIAPADEVLEGRAQYGVGNIELLSLYQQGKPLIALAAMYQHSPLVLLVLEDSDIYTVKDLKGKRVMLFPGHDDPELLGMLRMQDLTSNDIQRLDTSTNINDLINGRTDAFNAYMTNEPFFMQEKGIGVRVINPRDYGVDFYSDVLFSTQSELQNHPQRLAAFRRASLQGWRYALNHPEETIQILVSKYQVHKSLGHLRYESNMVREMIMPELVELGYMSETRWQHMLEQLVQLGIIVGSRSLDDFIYSAGLNFDWQRWLGWIFFGVILLVLFLGLSLRLILINRELGFEVSERKKAEEHARHLSLHDSLTGLPNRMLLMDRLDMLCKRALRNPSHTALLFIDLDKFKDVNDACGHDAGDQLLCDVAQRLNLALRAGDTIARYGGDEFVVLLDNITSFNEIGAIVEKLLQVLRFPQSCSEQLEPVTASIGLVRIEKGDTPASLLKKADQAMYYIKKHGKNGFADYQLLSTGNKFAEQ
ncbi:MAG: ABC transporter substrate-binding protein [Pseudomonadales bacterium]